MHHYTQTNTFVPGLGNAPIPVYCVTMRADVRLVPDESGPYFTLVKPHANVTAHGYNFGRVFDWHRDWHEVRERIAYSIEPEWPWWEKLRKQWNRATAPEVYCVQVGHKYEFVGTSEGPRLVTERKFAEELAASCDGKVLGWWKDWPKVRELLAHQLRPGGGWAMGLWDYLHRPFDEIQPN
jgi:hypothetical protein